MAFNTSSIFRAYVADLMEGVVENQGATSMDWVEATLVKAALFPDSVTPDNDAVAGSTAYNTGTWTDAAAIDDGTNWDVGGEPVTGRTLGRGTADVAFADGVDTPQGGASTTLAAVFGDMVYSDSITTPIADQGFAFHDYGGTQSVTAGNFTIIWHIDGVMRFTMTAV